jgi:hypothetical protein
LVRGQLGHNQTTGTDIGPIRRLPEKECDRDGRIIAICRVSALGAVLVRERLAWALVRHSSDYVGKRPRQRPIGLACMLMPVSQPGSGEPNRGCSRSRSVIAAPILDETGEIFRQYAANAPRTDLESVTYAPQPIRSATQYVTSALTVNLYTSKWAAEKHGPKSGPKRKPLATRTRAYAETTFYIPALLASGQ